MEKVYSREPLGTILGRSWADLGLSWAAPGGQNVWFYFGKRGTFEESLFGAQTSSKTPLGANLAQLGRPRGPKGPPRGAHFFFNFFGGNLGDPSAGALNRFTPQIALRALFPRRP